MLVVPFENAGDEPRLHWLGEASAVLLADGLKARGVSAISRDERVRAFERAAPAAVGVAEPRDGDQGRASCVGAAEVIVGIVPACEDDELTVQAHSIRMDAGGCSRR